MPRINFSIRIWACNTLFSRQKIGKSAEKNSKKAWLFEKLFFFYTHETSRFGITARNEN
jgi:hypothetical protein